MRIYPRTQHNDGTACVVVLTLITLVLIYVGVNLHTLHTLQREVRLVEHIQLKHWAQLPAPQGVKPAAAVPVP